MLRLGDDDFEQDVMKKLKLLEVILINVGKMQHELIVSLKDYCEKRN